MPKDVCKRFLVKYYKNTENLIEKDLSNLQSLNIINSCYKKRH